MRLFITQLIYVLEGEQKVFDEFESIAIPIISKYNGMLLLRVRPDQNAFVEYHIDRPYEIHLVSFDSPQDFEKFKQDSERKKVFASEGEIHPVLHHDCGNGSGIADNEITPIVVDMGGPAE